MNSNIKTAIFWVVLICLAVLLWTIVRQGKHPTEDQIAFTDFIAKVDKTSAAVGGLVLGTSAQIDRAAGELIRVAERR